MGTKFKLEIQIGNAAMREPFHVAHALGRVAVRLGDASEGVIRDENGNKVGTWSATWPESEES